MNIRPLWFVIVVAAFLLAGAVVTVAVAWRCAAVSPLSVPEAIDVNRTADLWDAYVGHPGPSPAIQGYSQHGPGVASVILSSFNPEPFELYLCSVTRAGWPLRCLEGQSHSYGKIGTTPLRSVHTVAIWVPPDPYLWGGLALPLSVLLLGFTLNTAFFSVLLSLAALLAARIRRHARLDRGECPRCCYQQTPPYSSDGPCTECGYCYRRVLHTRPKQILRLWMIPLLVPQLLFVLLWFVGSVNWTVLRIEIRFNEPILTVTSASSVTTAMLWLTVIGYHAYSDRRLRQRQLLSVSVALLTSVTAYIALFSLLAMAYE